VQTLNTQKITKEVKTTLSRNGVKESKEGQIEFIIDRYFHYLIPLLLHGFVSAVPKMFRFRLVYNIIHSIPKKLKKNVFFSSKAFGHFFFIQAESENMDHYGYVFKTDRNLIKYIAEHNEDDIIYQLLKK
jgi:hypothetical protein